MPVGYLLARAGHLVLLVVTAVTVNFLIPRLLAGGSLASPWLQARLGLDRPLWQQYLTYWGRLARLDLGLSAAHYPATVVSVIAGALPWTLGLLTASTLLAFGLGSLLGAVLAWPGTPRVVRPLALPLLALSAVPPFLLAILLVALVVVEAPIFPPAGPFDPIRIPRADLATALDILAHALLPTITLTLSGLGAWALTMRGAMVSVLGEDYLLFAEAKGLPPRRIFLRYGLRNALLPQVTSLALALGAALSGTLLVEVIFTYPGLGGLLYDAAIKRDFPVLQGITLLLIGAMAVALGVVELAYPLLDPRIRLRR